MVNIHPACITIHNTAAAHDAGYDAYITGYLFFYAAKLLKLNIKSIIKNDNYAKIFKNKVILLYLNIFYHILYL